MLTQNGKIYFRSANISNQENCTLINLDGTDMDHFCPNTAYGGILVGTGGSTPASSSDYCLSSQNDELTLVANTATQNQNRAADFMNAFSATYKNNTDHTVNISELGVYYYNTYVSRNPSFLVIRETFDPISIEPGKSYTFSVVMG